VIHYFHEAVDRVGRALDLVAVSAAHISVGWVIVGTLLSVFAQVVRVRGWHTIIRAAYPDADQLRQRDTAQAYLAGAGLNGVIPARGGDVVKLALVHRRVPESSYATLAATFVPETVFETLFGTGLVAWALARGFLPVPTAPGELPSLDVTFVLRHPVISAVATGVIIVGGTMLIRWIRRGAEEFAERFKQGMVIFGSPRRFITGVASWQALSRVIRLGSLAAFMQAFQLPVTLETVVLVMAAQGGGRIIPLAPVSAGLRLAMLSYGFVEVTGHNVNFAAITTFTVGVGAVLLVTGLLISFVILAREFDTLDPRRALRRARSALGRRAPSRQTSG
jgi:hypothetical protein